MIREFIGLLKTFRRQNIALNMWKIVKKKCINVVQEAVAPLLLKSQESAQECWKCEIVLQIRRSADKVPSAIKSFYRRLPRLVSKRKGLVTLASSVKCVV